MRLERALRIGGFAICRQYSATRTMFQLVREIFEGLGVGRDMHTEKGERMGGRLIASPAETRLIAPKVAGSADGEVKSWGTVTGHVENKHTTTARRFFLRAGAF
ncbi:hypothetical protein C8J57DRAFT_1261389 [Mycena rebaudengoi]|nr:hypothetical protein C8J57DRAFT_1261389 [Mycena rebaudengoi]